MTVLMFGWEFPPHIAGGLGTACEGIVKGLAHNGVKSIFVMPSASGDEDQTSTTIINASDVAVESFENSVDEFLDKVKFVHIGSNLIPYADPEEFSRLVEEDRKRQVKDFAISYGQKYKFSGKYPVRRPVRHVHRHHRAALPPGQGHRLGGDRQLRPVSGLQRAAAGPFQRQPHHHPHRSHFRRRGVLLPGKRAGRRQCSITLTSTSS